MLIRTLNKSFQQITAKIKYNTKIYVNGSSSSASLIKLSVNVHNQSQLTPPQILDSGLCISNNSKVLFQNSELNSRIISTKLKINLSNKDLNMDINHLNGQKYIEQINQNRQSPTLTPQVSRIIIESEVIEDKSKDEDPYRYIKNNIVYVQKVIKSIIGINPGFLIEKSTYENKKYLQIIDKKRKAIDLNILETLDNQNTFFQFLFDNCYKLDHIYLKGYRKHENKYIREPDLNKNQIDFKQLFKVLKMNYFKGVIVVEADIQHITSNLEIIEKDLHDCIYVSKIEKEINDDWLVI